MGWKQVTIALQFAENEWGEEQNEFMRPGTPQGKKLRAPFRFFLRNGWDSANSTTGVPWVRF
jgi:hypothetical protein